VRTALWGSFIAVPGLVGGTVAAVGGSWFFAALNFLVVAAGVGVVGIAWRIERKSDQRLAELVRRAYGAQPNGGERVRR
jgi:hypothetical protein